MTDTTRIIGIGGNIAPPNPRLPAYLIPSIIPDTTSHVNQILLVSSLDAAKKYSESEPDSRLVEFNTRQKIDCLLQFKQSFFPDAADVSFHPHEESDFVEDATWLSLWGTIEKTFSEQENTEVGAILSRYNTGDTIDTAKIYAIRHALWFFDIGFTETHGELESIGGPQEAFFNFIREKVSGIPVEILQEIFHQPMVQNKVKKIIFPYDSQVIQYGEATRKTGKKRVSIEKIIGEPETIGDHYSGNQQRKSNLHTDIGFIHEHIDSSDYQDFWSDFERTYLSNLQNI